MLSYLILNTKWNFFPIKCLLSWDVLSPGRNWCGDKWLFLQVQFMSISELPRSFVGGKKGFTIWNYLTFTLINVVLFQFLSAPKWIEWLWATLQERVNAKVTLAACRRNHSITCDDLLLSSRLLNGNNLNWCIITLDNIKCSITTHVNKFDKIASIAIWLWTCQMALELWCTSKTICNVQYYK